ncbi:MAG: hypothetical protein WEB63_09785 [Cucumibacter sp.]
MSAASNFFHRAVETLFRLSMLRAEARTGFRYDVGPGPRPFIQDQGR